MTTPEVLPAAPIVWHDSRTPLPSDLLSTFANVARDADFLNRRRARGLPELGPEFMPAVGDLWQREAERDVQAHGEPTPRLPLRRLEPEPSNMARTGLALGLAFTSDDAKA